MTWPQATVTILEGLGGMIVFIALFTNIFESLINRNKTEIEVRVEVVPENLRNELIDLIDEIRDVAGDDNKAMPPSERKRLFEWASTIEQALNEVDED